MLLLRMSYAYNVRPLPQNAGHKTPRRNFTIPLIVLMAVLAVYTGYCLLRPLETPKTTLLPPVLSGSVDVNVPWPSAKQSAFGADGFGLLSSHNEQTPMPTASIAKVITAYAVLEKKPLSPGQQGPMITITPQDQASYYNYAAIDGSVVPVYAGEKISQYQALQAMMLPSANNIADTTAIWAFGSLEAYRNYANSMVKRLGMTQTTVGSDASGFSPTTLSTGRDLVRLADAALDNPVFSEIIGQSQATFPEYGTIENVNSLLGTSGIRGIKTGNTDEAGGCFLGAADVVINGKKITVITAILGAPNRTQALRQTVPMVQSAVSLFRTVHVVKSGDKVGRITSRWGETADITAKEPINVLIWNGSSLSPKLSLDNISSTAQAGTKVGMLSLKYSGSSYSSDLQTDSAIHPPSVWWKLSHPF